MGDWGVSCKSCPNSPNCMENDLEQDWNSTSGGTIAQITFLFNKIREGYFFWFESDRLGKNTWILLIMRPAYVSTCHFATQDSLLRTTTRTSSTCTGAYTSEMSLAVIQKTINESKALSFNVCFRPVSAHETWSVNWSFFQNAKLTFSL